MLPLMVAFTSVELSMVAFSIADERMEEFRMVLVSMPLSLMRDRVTLVKRRTVSSILL